MKPGDVVKLVLPDDWAAADHDQRRVIVSCPQGEGERSTHTKFPEGTVAVFLAPAGTAAASILIEGRVGWVWSKYLEAV